MEVSIVSVLREVIVRGVSETPWMHILSTEGLLLVTSSFTCSQSLDTPTFEGIDLGARIDPEARIVQSYNSHKEVSKN